MRTRLLVLPLLLLSACAGPYEQVQEYVAEPPREFRAAWIATVHNIDWPSKPGLPSQVQQAELIALLDLAERVRLNAVIFQIRPACDALYASKLEPWSHYLTGRSGKPPEPAYDPLEFAVREAHKRGLELHAWFNPYRASAGAGEPPGATNAHVTQPGHPLHHAVRSYGKLKLLDPGLPEVQKHSRDVILDVVRRYDVDAVHMDDYFYPYPLKRKDGSTVPFPDAATFRAAKTTLKRNAWRRANVDAFVRELWLAVRAVEPWVRVGIAPFGIWRPKHPPKVRGLDAYEALAADTRRWFREGWVDYMAPQLYWGIGFPEQPFDDLLRWWEQQNTQARHLWPGIATRWIRSKRDPKRDAAEITTQIQRVRNAVHVLRPGHIHWNLSALKEDRGGVVEALLSGPYRRPALVPASSWLGEDIPRPLRAITFQRVDAGVRITWDAGPGARWIALQRDDGEGWRYVGVRRADAVWSLEDRPKGIALHPVSPTGRVGPAQVFRTTD